MAPMEKKRNKWSLEEQLPASNNELLIRYQTLRRRRMNSIWSRSRFSCLSETRQTMLSSFCKSGPPDGVVMSGT